MDVKVFGGKNGPWLFGCRERIFGIFVMWPHAKFRRKVNTTERVKRTKMPLIVATTLCPHCPRITNNFGRTNRKENE